MSTKQLLLAWMIIGNLFPSFSLLATEPWTTIEEERKQGITVRLLLAEHPQATSSEWIGLEIINEGLEDVEILKANYRMELRAYSTNSKTPVVEGFFSVQNPTDFLELPPNLNFANASVLPIGAYQCTNSMSAYAAALLGYPSKGALNVKALLYLELEVKGKEKINIEWPEVDFGFQWYFPSEETLQGAKESLIHLLHHPQNAPFQHQQMLTLLANPLLQKDLDVGYLLKALQIRKGAEDGRLAIVQYLNEHFSDEDLLHQHYRKLLHKKDYSALNDLAVAPNIWNDQFLEPLIGWFQQGNSGAMFRIMDVMYAHQKNWLKKPGIATILSDLILYKYEDLIHKSHVELSDRELLVWCSAASLLGKTGNPEVRSILCPYLACKSSVLDSSLELDFSSIAIPRPLRVADVALEALLQLEHTGLEKTYLKAGFRPPYEYGDAEIIITRIRDELIFEIQGQCE